MEDKIKCEHCGGYEGLEDHTCPFAEDIHGDYESECNCCDNCIKQCLADI